MRTAAGDGGESEAGVQRERGRSGAGTILELNSAQLSQTQAQLNFSQAIYDYLSAKAEYDRIVGREHGNK